MGFHAKTERLLLRPFRPEDWQDLYAYLSEPEVTRYEPYEPLSKKECMQEAARRAQSDDFIAICLPDDSKMIGNLYLAGRNYLAWELGYVLSPAYQKRGYATEAAQKGLELAFGQYGAHRVIAQCNPENTASWKLLERLGMRREAHFIQDVYFNNDPDNPAWQDTYQYGLLAAEYKK